MKTLKIFEHHVLIPICEMCNSTNKNWHWIETIPLLLRQKMNIFKKNLRGLKQQLKVISSHLEVLWEMASLRYWNFFKKIRQSSLDLFAKVRFRFWDLPSANSVNLSFTKVIFSRIFQASWDAFRWLLLKDWFKVALGWRILAVSNDIHAKTPLLNLTTAYRFYKMSG